MPKYLIFQRNLLILQNTDFQIEHFYRIVRKAFSPGHQGLPFARAIGSCSPRTREYFLSRGNKQGRIALFRRPGLVAQVMIALAGA